MKYKARIWFKNREVSYYRGVPDKGYYYDQVFDTLEKALKAAKDTVRETKEDVTIWKESHVVKFPEPSYEVVELS